MKMSVHTERFKAFRDAMLLVVLVFNCLLAPEVACAQSSARHYVTQGNKLFRSGDYANAEVAYRKALEKDTQNPQALYNLGNSLMAQQKDSAAIVEFEKAARVESNPLRKAMSYHNMGVICQQRQLFGDAIEAYKQALRLNPADDETRYNLELCKRQNKNQNDNKNQQNKDDKDKKDNKEQNKQDQNKNQDKKDDQQPPQSQPPQMSKENAEQLLKAAMQQEKQTQERMKKAQQQPQRRSIQKNW